MSRRSLLAAAVLASGALVSSPGYAADALSQPDARERLERQERFFSGGARAARNEPRNVVVKQFNHEGTPIPWAGTAKTTEVYFTITGNPIPNPNDCRVRGVMEIELRDGHEKFQYRRTLPRTRAACLPGDCRTLTATSGFLRLEPGKAYKWQARLVAIYDWLECTNSGCRCTGEVSRSPGYWNQVGPPVPGYFSFFTP